ncbi:MAG TPA: phosphoribosylformylglycinamidine cyclo-ligase [Oligoflexus sp.]|uniref:phosphoribosylformylglycinamidine cyclo-ligase n=1 Tax=Oligoflexus sp. TaxID=1971216 RepID=UPI002D7E6F4B|nr:phosphoribosylformylglycinamidine cyclo-ligase [Oligoflexus sp.]HET9236999.1 phosphoribosylformylglycinamidine cyclo-ligase [Oligoflexus sp.]
MTEQKGKDLYKESGVDVAKGDALVDWLQSRKADQVKGGEVVSGIGGFAALFRPDFSGMEDPLLVSGTDGVGTKVLLGIEHDQLEGLGVDLVAMCVNDLYTVGGRPLFFLDYYATGILDEKQFKAILSGIRKGLEQSNAALLGGETAELPGLYEKGHFDLAGFVVGVVDGKKRLRPELVQRGDKLIALSASGFHSNGYSLVRKWLAEKPVDQATLNRILEPTKIYYEVPELLKRLGWGPLHGLANITGGGISGNLPRVLPEGLDPEIDPKKIPTPDWMRAFYESHGARFEDVEGVFNMGAGMIAVVAADAEATFHQICKDLGLGSTTIGQMIPGSGESTVRYL